MMSRDAEADDMNWQTNTWMKAAYLGWQCNMNETNGYNYKFADLLSMDSECQ